MTIDELENYLLSKGMIKLGRNKGFPTMGYYIQYKGFNFLYKQLSNSVIFCTLYAGIDEEDYKFRTEIETQLKLEFSYDLEKLTKEFVDKKIKEFDDQYTFLQKYTKNQKILKKQRKLNKDF